MAWAEGEGSTTTIKASKMDETHLEKKQGQAGIDAYPDKAAGNVIALGDNEAEQFYGSSTTHSYRLKSELVGRCMEDIGMGK